MNKIFTLFAFAFCLSITTKTSAQISEGFETFTEIEDLKSACWQFNNFSFVNQSPVSSAGSVQSQTGLTGEIVTPFLNIPTDNLTISFTYKEISSVSGEKKIQVFLDNGISRTKIDMFNVGNGTVTFSKNFKNSNTPGANISGSQKVVIEASPNVSVQIDNVTINAGYTNLGGCEPPAPITLPVKLINFQGSIQANKGQLKWAVAENETGDRFEVLRSADGKNFTTAGVVFINGKIGAESYAYTDGVELNAVTYYQLKIVNKNGSITYSNVITLKSAANKQGSVISILQNPVASTLTFSYTSASSTQSNIAIYNTNGVKVYGSRISSLKGSNAVSLPLDRHMAPGTYILEVSNDTERAVSKLIKQ
jgi:hypothetical protein